MVRSILVAAALAVGLSGCNTAYNYFEEEPDPAGPTRHANAFGAILSMGGITQQDTGPIAYTPRAPLAMPGSRDLPQPADGSAAEAAVNFPEDHDVRQRRLSAESEARNFGVESAADRRDSRNPGDESGSGRFLPGELNGMSPEPKSIDQQYGPLGDPGERLNRQEMKLTIKGHNKPRGMLTEDGEAAPRLSLIHPPSDYRTPSDTASLPEKKKIENSNWLKGRLYKDRQKQDPGARTLPQ